MHGDDADKAGDGDKVGNDDGTVGDGNGDGAVGNDNDDNDGANLQRTDTSDSSH